MSIRKKLFGDIGVNITAMCMFMVAQHGIMMPFLSKTFSDRFSEVILFVTLSSIYVYITAGALGNTLLMRNTSYRNKREHGDFGIIILFFALSLIVVILGTHFYFRVFDFTDVVLALGTVSLFLLRSFFGSTVILRRKYIIIVWQNALYLLGVVFSCYCFEIDTPMLAFFFAEVLAAIVTGIFFEFMGFNLAITSEFLMTLKTYMNFAVITCIDNLVTYADRLLIYPMLGGEALNILFAITVASKGILLLVSPIKNVLLGLLAETGFDERKHAARYLRKSLIHWFCPIYIISTVISWAGLFFLYPQFLSVGMNYILITSLGITMTVMNSLCNIFCMKFISSKMLSHYSVVRIIAFCCITFSFTKLWDMDGFIYSLLLTECIVLCFNAYCIWRLIDCDNDKIFAMD